MVGDDLGDQRQAQARCRWRLVVTKGSNRWSRRCRRACRGRCPGRCTVERQRRRRSLAAGHARPARRAGRRWRGRSRRAVAGVGRLGGVLHQVEEDLDQLVVVAPDRRQRRVVVLDEAHDARRSRSAATRRTWSSTWWMLTGAALDRAVVGEHLHPVDQARDAVGLVADQLRPARGRPRRRACSSSCAAPRMPESGFFTSCASIAAMAGDRARGAAVSQLAVERRAMRARPAAPAPRAPGFSAAARHATATPRRLQPRAVERQVVVGDRRIAAARTWSIRANSGLSRGEQVARAAGRAAAVRRAPKNCSAAVVGEAHAVRRHRARPPAIGSGVEHAPASATRRRSHRRGRAAQAIAAAGACRSWPGRHAGAPARSISGV